MNNPIELHTGCVFSGKTKNAIISAEKDKSKTVMYFKVKDESDVYTHKLNDGSKLKRTSVTIKNSTDCANYFLTGNLSDVIMIDDAHFSEETWLYDAVKEAQSMGYRVIITCLDRYWHGKAPFILNLLNTLPSHEIRANNARCDCGAKAEYTARISGKDFPKCKKCFREHRKLQKRGLDK